MDSSPLRAVTFCRFGYDESLTLDRVVQLIDQKELWPGELLQIDGAKEWKAARDFPQLRPYFGDGAGRPVDARRRKPYERGERPPFRLAFTPDDGADFDVGQRVGVRVFGASLVLWSAFWLFLTLPTLSVEWRSAGWPTTTGVALRASPNDSDSTDVTYEYVVTRAHYRGKDTLDFVRKGDEVRVRYNPARPGTSTLADGIRGRTVGFVFIGVVAIALGAGLMIFPAGAAALVNAGS
jgi:hypothetical protein